MSRISLAFTVPQNFARIQPKRGQPQVTLCPRIIRFTKFMSSGGGSGGDGPVRELNCTCVVSGSPSPPFVLSLTAVFSLSGGDMMRVTLNLP